jgi:DNA-binding PadR family transcriptional regulator
LLVLELLDVQPMSGYDIQQMFKLTDAERWGGVLVGSIYHALKKMEAEKLVEVSSIEQTGHRQKAVYQITEQGRVYLKQLALDSLKASSVAYPSTLYAGLSYVHQLPKEEALAALEQQAAALEQEYRSLEQGLQEKAAALGGELPAMSGLIFENMFAIIRQQQETVAKAIQLVNA